MSDITIALDAGHGGSDPGAVYDGRSEKNDALRLTKAVGKILSDNGINVFYVRSNDEYETPFKKAQDANAAGADYFISIHRNSSEEPNQYSGVETLVYKDSGIRNTLATNINKSLSKAGFANLGITERPNLVVLKRTSMPAVLVEVGFINSDKDNATFDANFDKIAQAIAGGILQSIYSEASSTSVDNPSDYTDGTVPEDEGYETYPDNGENEVTPPYKCPCTQNEMLYRVQVGAYSNKDNADRMLDSLIIEGFPAYILHEKNLYKVQVGAFQLLTNAIKMEQRLRKFRYNTYIVSE
jgi:N-acetylmuramoyl-L-alanine amidase